MFLKISRFFFLFTLLMSPVAALAAPVQGHVLPKQESAAVIKAQINTKIQDLIEGSSEEASGEEGEKPKEEGGFDIEPKETFGTKALSIILDSFKLVMHEGESFVDNFAAVPQLKTWVETQINDKGVAARWKDIGYNLAFVLGLALLMGWVADFLFISFRRRLYEKKFTSVSSRIKGIVTWFLFSLLPLVLFLSTALVTIDYLEVPKLSRFVVMTIIYAFALIRLVRILTRLILSPNVPSLRLVPISSDQAKYARKWIRIFSAVMIWGYYLIEVARVVKAPDAAISGFKSLIALIVIGLTITLILQKKSSVSTIIRGNLSAAYSNLTLIQSLRLWLARTWHVLAITYLVIGYFVTMLGNEDAFMLMQKGTIGTLLSFFVARLLFYMAARIERRRKRRKGGVYRIVFQFIARVLACFIGLLGAIASWGGDVPTLLSGAWGQRIIGSTLSITSSVLIIVLIYELFNSFVENKLHPRDEEGNELEPTSRVKTLLPIARYVVVFTLSVIAGFVVLSELGVNTAPLLAGAGVLGVAIGFGSQTLVKDFLTGLFIIMEETISIGDIVRVGDDAGLVESMSIRTVRLRDVEGNLHILPYSEISRITNSSKEFGQALIEIGVSYDSDIQKVMDIMTDVGNRMMEESEFKDDIIDPIDIMGLQTFGDSAITVRARIKTKPNKQWSIKRAYNLRLKVRFDEEKIEIPFPQQVLYVRNENGDDKKNPSKPDYKKLLKNEKKRKKKEKKEEEEGILDVKDVPEE